MSDAMISSKLQFDSHFIEILGSQLHYLDHGSGDPILFLHGIPTSCYVWRNVIPHLTTLGRCIAPDLIGLGKSDKPNIEYSITDHIRYIEKFIETLNLKRITVVMHGWGSIIGCDYAMRYENNCKGLVFYEAYLRQINGEDVSLPLQEQIASLEKHENFSDLILNSSYFVDQVLPQSTIRKISKEVLDIYRQPFMEKGCGKPLQQYLKELPRDNKQNLVNDIIDRYSKRLKASALPKLLLYSVPGFVTPITTAMWAKKELPNLEMIDIGEEFHFAQESNPKLMGDMISAWLQAIQQTTA